MSTSQRPPEHSPLPWTARESSDSFWGWIVDSPKTCAVATATCQIDAEHIVRCVNVHDELVAALRGMVDWFELRREKAPLDDARIALAKAEAQ